MVIVGWQAKIIALATGLVLIAIGAAFIRFGAPLIASLNQMYARLPGRFQYPRWFHLVFGSAVCGFGLFILILSLTMPT